MKRYVPYALCALLLGLSARAQQPLYIVNGQPAEEIESIPPEEIESTERLPADEETIARYGEKASNGVILVTLRYDRQAVFPGDVPFDDYVAARVEWPDDEPAARVVIRCTVTAEGEVIPDEILESTDNRLRRRVLKALEELPRWQPATKGGKAIESEQVLRIQLPAGKPMPRPVELIWR